MKKTILNKFLLGLIFASVILLAMSLGDRISRNFSYINYAYADTLDSLDAPPLPSMPQNVSGMFNERGYSTSNSISHDESEIINDFNGNLQYSFPMYNLTGPGDMKINVSLNYNSNVAYNILAATQTTAQGNNHNLPQHNFNAPGWIISVNGMAVQMTNFETKMLTEKVTGSATEDDAVRLLAVGYQLTDRLSHVYPEKDHINIMMGDGSVLKLENKASNSYTGDYYSTNKKTFAWAKVTFKPGQTVFDVCKERIVELNLGDGLTYIYEDRTIQYYDFPYGGSGCLNRPIVMELVKIRDRYGYYLNLHYTYADLSKQYGRRCLEEIQPTWTSNSNILFGYQMNPGSAAIETSHPVKGDYRIDMFPFTAEQHGQHRPMVTKFTNPENKSVNISYENYRREAENLVYNDGNERINITVGKSTGLRRMSSLINFNGGKRTYTYAGDNSLKLTMFEPGEGNPAKHSNTSNFWGNGRDAFYTNMVRVKESFDKGSAQSYKKEVFDYGYEDLGEDDAEYDPVDENDNFTATKTIMNTNFSTFNQTPDTLKTVKHFKNYNTYSVRNIETADWPGETKILKEEYFRENNLTPFRTIDYQFDKGDLNTLNGENVYNGKFLDTAVIETIGDAIRKNRFSYTQFEDYFYSNTDTEYKFNNPLKKKIEIDPLGNKTETVFKKMDGNTSFYVNGNYTGNAFDETQFIFITGLLDSIKKFDKNNNLTFLETFEYIQSDTSSKGYIFQLLNKKTHNPSYLADYKLFENEYYKKDTLGKHLYNNNLSLKPETEGMLEKTVDAIGNINKFYYHPVVINEKDRSIIKVYNNQPYLFYKKLFEGSTVIDSSTWENKGLPTRVDSYTQGDLYKSIYCTYDVSGNMTKIFDENNYLNQFSFDKLDRIQSATLPYDFNNGTDTSYYVRDTTFVPFEETWRSTGWGYKDDAQDTSHYATYHAGLDGLNLLRMRVDVSGEDPDHPTSSDVLNYPVIGFNTVNGNSISQIDSAFLIMRPVYINDTLNGTAHSSDHQLRIIPITSLSLATVGDYESVITSMAQGSSSKDIPLQNINGFRTPYSCTDLKYRYGNDSTFNRIDITSMMASHIATGHNNFQGLRMISRLASNTVGADRRIDIDWTNCLATSYSASTMFTSEWSSNYSPVIVVKGIRRVIDSSLVTIPKPSTLAYVYDDANNKVTTFNKLSGSTFKKNETVFDGFYRIKEARIYTGTSTYNSFKTEYNYLDQKSKSTDAKGNITKLSHDEFGDLKRTENPDSSFTKDTVVFMDTLVTSLANYYGFIEKTSFADEESNSFEKYFDAVGNLIRETKFLSGVTGGGEGPPMDIALNTDYLYDSLYRVVKVRTPEGKEITYKYDAFGRQTQRTTVDAGTEKLLYNKNDNLIYSQDAKQRTIGANVYTERKYDGLNRLIILGETSSGGIQQEFDSLLIGDTLETDNISTADYLVVNVFDTLSTAPSGVTFTPPVGYTSVLNNTKGQLVATAYRTHNGDPWSFKYFRYDARGRIIKMWNIIDNLPPKVIDYTYNSQDQATNVNYQTDSSDVKKFNYWYDTAGRLGSVSYHIPGYTNIEDTTDAPGSYKNLTRYAYDSNSNVSNHNFDSDDITTSIAYNSRNWIQQTWNTFFRYGLTYHQNGNVQEMFLTGSYDDNLPKGGANLSFEYTYDKSNRLLKQDFLVGSDNTFTVENTYDKDGNILTLKRYGGSNDLVDDFAYAYYDGKNRLSGVDGEAPGSKSQYTYDSSGNVTKDNVNGIFNIKYDHRNLLTEFSRVVDNVSFATRYYYDDAGNRIKKIILRATQPEPETPNWDSVQSLPPTGGDEGPGIVWTVDKIEYYVRDAAGKELAIYNGNLLDLWNIWGLDNFGKIENDGKPFFYMKDHLGSIHAILDTAETVVSTQDFDIWGHELPGRTSQPQDAKYDFTGKERDTETGYDYFGARYYDSKIGRWGGVEPLLDKYPDVSPYIYGLNNAIITVDPDGSDPRVQDAYINDPDEIGKGVHGTSSLVMGKLIIEFVRAVVIPTIRVSSGLLVIKEILESIQGKVDEKLSEEIRLEIEKAHAVHSTEEIVVEANTDHPQVIVDDDKKVPNSEIIPPPSRGLAPISIKDGKPIEIHHENQNPNGPYREMHRTDHRGKGNYSKNHPVKGASKINRKAFEREKREYWKREWDKGRFGKK